AAQPRQQLAQAHAGDRSGDRPIRTADVVRRLWLGIEAVDVACPAVLHDEDAGARAGLARWSRRRPRRKELRQAEPKQADAADLKQLTTVKSSVAHRCTSVRVQNAT